MPYGYTVDLFDGSGFTDEKFRIEGPFYEDETLRHSCIPLDKFNDKVSSLEVQKTAQLGEKARGYWTGIT